MRHTENLIGDGHTEVNIETEFRETGNEGAL
jgi:hypothetical protein